MNHCCVTRSPGARFAGFAARLLLAGGAAPWLLAAAGCAERVVSQVGAPAEDSAGATTDYVACYVHGDKIGYGQTTTRPLREGKRRLLEITHHSHLEISRFGDRNQLDIETTSVESPAGELFRFRAETRMGGESKVISGTRAGNEMLLETTVAGSAQKSRMPWLPEYRGFHGAEQSLEREPLAPGQARQLKMLVPLADQVLVADVELTAGEYETVGLLAGSQQLLRVDQRMSMPGVKGGGIQSANWVDERGRLIKSVVPGLEQTTYRTSREQALEAGAAPAFDLGLDVIIKIDQPLPAPFQTRRVRYRVELDGADPLEMFVSGPTQQVTRSGPHAAEIVVTAPSALAAPKPAAGKPPVADSPPGPDDSGPNSMLQSNDPLIVAMAQEARGEQTEPVAVALALEKFVHRTVQTKDFSQGFDTALEVARSKQGDCTEHAVLLAALARASRLPARVAVGLVYVESEQGFGYHMWTEVFAGGRWLPLDATLGLGGIRASHLKLGDSNLHGASTFTSLLSVMQVVGRLKISVLEAQ